LGLILVKGEERGINRSFHFGMSFSSLEILKGWKPLHFVGGEGWGRCGCCVCLSVVVQMISLWTDMLQLILNLSLN